MTAPLEGVRLVGVSMYQHGPVAGMGLGEIAQMKQDRVIGKHEQSLS